MIPVFTTTWLIKLNAKSVQLDIIAQIQQSIQLFVHLELTEEKKNKVFVQIVIQQKKQLDIIVYLRLIPLFVPMELMQMTLEMYVKDAIWDFTV